MKFESVKNLDEEKFRRLTGVKRSTFNRMINILEDSMRNRKAHSGRKKKLSLENALLMSLESRLSLFHQMEVYPLMIRFVQGFPIL
ncbi:hypothetical protein [Candidatus Rhabdochlamydia porcellionis]|jgi:hypothetical protein|uniref:Mobile element protein n=1 Tax=Candidatus Rhabdochlamydia porcellionis TaxID=225148 RepID=A0ABX8Z1S3_9BACT|nr:hypothetical protein [Candidatus Rhabdochlamydia porcellionis]QZA58263.1 hypothetical protein RHAB15C_0000135 [Candidatus Rhabdochlamydia porcellionis]